MSPLSVHFIYHGGLKDEVHENILVETVWSTLITLIDFMFADLQSQINQP